MAETVNQNTAATDGKSFPETGKKLPDAPNGGGTAGQHPAWAFYEWLHREYAEPNPEAGEAVTWIARPLLAALTSFCMAEGPFEAPAFAAAMPSGGQWRPIDIAPKDGTLFLAHAEAGQHDLPAMYSLCAWHPDAGFCIDELREPTHWQPLPPAPCDGSGEAGTTQSGVTEGDSAVTEGQAPQPPSSTEGEENFRKQLAFACNDPGHFVGYKSERSLGYWQADALLAGPLTSLRSELKAVREERGNLRERVEKLEAELATRQWRPTGSGTCSINGVGGTHEWFRPSDGRRESYPHGFDPNAGAYVNVAINSETR